MYFPIISETDNKLLKYYKKYATDPVIRQRMMVIDLRCRRVPCELVASLVGVHLNSITNWVKIYIAGGLLALLDRKYYRPQSDLVTYRDKILEDFKEQPPTSIGQARKRIATLTGIKRSVFRIRQFLKRVLGFKYRKYKRTAGGKRSVTELNVLQVDFLHQTLFPLLQKARRCCNHEVFFVDAVHPVQGFHQGQVWSLEPVVVRTSTGRHRVNVLGALNALRPEMYSVTEPAYVNAKTVCELIRYLRAEHPGKSLHLVMDNARYQRCRLVESCAKKFNINLVFLPPYSPNLNLIERLWKLMKKEALAGKYYATKQEFEAAVVGFLDRLNEGEYEEQITSLLTTNFQTLDEPTEKFTSCAGA